MSSVFRLKQIGDDICINRGDGSEGVRREAAV